MITQNNPANKTFLSGFWLITAVVVVVLRVYLLGIGVIHRPVGFDYSLIVVAGLSFACCFLWARSIGTRSGINPPRLMQILGGVGFVLSVIAGYLSIGLVVPPAVELLGVEGESHVGYVIAFVTVTAVITGGTGLFVGLGLKDWRLALGLLWRGFLTGAVVFYLTDLLMVALGFQVGSPRPDGIPSMPVVTALGVSITALIGSAVFGQVLGNWARGRVNVAETAGN